MEMIFEKQPVLTDKKMQENSGSKEARESGVRIIYPSWQKKEETEQ